MFAFIDWEEKKKTFTDMKFVFQFAPFLCYSPFPEIHESGAKDEILIAVSNPTTLLICFQINSDNFRWGSEGEGKTLPREAGRM